MARFPKLVKDNAKYRFIDLNGVMSDEFNDASRYSEGFAPVQINKDGDYFYRDIFGDLSRSGYFCAFSYCEGYGVVKLYQTGKFYFVDVDGNLSQDCYDYVSFYNEGFVRVQNKLSIFYRDLLGNVSKSKTYLGNCINEYYYGRITLQELLKEKKLPYDEKLKSFILRNEKHKLRQKFFIKDVENCNDEDVRGQIENRLKRVSKLLRHYEENAFKMECHHSRLNKEKYSSVNDNHIMEIANEQKEGDNKTQEHEQIGVSYKICQREEQSEEEKALFSAFERMMNKE